MAGVLAPLFALRTENDLGIGDTDALRQFIDWSAEIGFKLVQLLPVNEIGRDNSPYNAISSVALEPTTLHLAPGSPKDLTAEDFEATLAKFDLPKLRRGNVNYRRVRRLKAELLERAFARFDERRGTDDSVAQDFEEFCRAEAAWLEDYALFRALMERNRGRETWDRWPENHRSLGAARRWLDGLGPKRRTIFETRLRFFRYVQWTAFEQWRSVKNYAEQRGVALMGDVPFGVSYYSADVFAQPELFALEWSGGAPPEPYFHEDEFTQKWGQNWGIPLYNWPEMRARDLAWWRRRVHEVRQFFHLFRIDHVLGFYRIYAFPWRPEHNAEFISLRWEEMRQRTGGREPHFAPRDDQSWSNCEANRREGEEYLRSVLAEAGGSRVVGEDLGTVPPYVRPSLHSLGIAGFKIPQWETHENGSVCSGHEYPRLSVTTYVTHDHQPLRLMWEQALQNGSERERHDLNLISQFAGLAAPNEQMNYLREFYPRVLEALFKSESWLAIVMVTDLLARKERFNVPGRATSSNWTRRLHATVAELSARPAVQRRMRVVQRLLRGAGR